MEILIKFALNWSRDCWRALSTLTDPSCPSGVDNLLTKSCNGVHGHEWQLTKCLRFHCNQVNLSEILPRSQDPGSFPQVSCQIDQVNILWVLPFHNELAEIYFCSRKPSASSPFSKSSERNEKVKFRHVIFSPGCADATLNAVKEAPWVNGEWASSQQIPLSLFRLLPAAGIGRLGHHRAIET